MKIVSKQFGDENIPIRFGFAITNFCNYNCPYCCYPITTQKKDLLSWVALEAIYSKIKEFDSYGRPLNLSILGGEPTLHPDLPRFVEKLSHLENLVVTLVTNLSSQKKYFDHFQGLPRFRISASYHLPKANLQKFVQNMLYIKELGIEFYPILLADPNYFKECQEAYQTLAKYCENLQLKCLYEFFKNKKMYSPEYLEWMFANDPKTYLLDEQPISYNELVYRDLINLKGSVCPYGLYNVSIRHDGFYTFMCDPSGYHIFSQINVENFLKTIANYEFRCPMDQCLCDSTMKMPKLKQKL